MNILLSKSSSAKKVAIEENFLKKICEVCSENINAIHLAEIQKLSTKGPKVS
jgi:hypothetical protein